MSEHEELKLTARLRAWAYVNADEVLSGYLRHPTSPVMGQIYGQIRARVRELAWWVRVRPAFRECIRKGTQEGIAAFRNRKEASHAP